MKLLLTVLAVLGVSRGERVAHIFLNAGQSNAEGWNSDGHTAEDVAYPNIWQLDCCSNNVALPADQCVFSIAQDPLHHRCGEDYLNGITVGFGMSFARAFREEMDPDDVIIIVPAAIYGSGFFGGGWVAYTGHGFVAATDKVKRAYNLIASNYTEFTPKFEGIVWQQGTHDAGANLWGLVSNTSHYLFEDIVPMVEAFRDPAVLPFTYPQLPFLCANMLQSWGGSPDHPQRAGVYIGIALTDQLIPYSACPPSFGLVGDPKYPAGPELIHFTAASNRLLGKRYHAALKLAQLNGPA